MIDVCSGNPGESHEDSTQSGNQWWLDLAHALTLTLSPFNQIYRVWFWSSSLGWLLDPRNAWTLIYIYTYIYISYIIYNITIYFIIFHHISSLHHIFRPPKTPWCLTGISTLGPSNPDRNAMVVTRQRDLCAAHGGPNPSSVGLLPRGELP
jgi:hypothetical protein